MTQRFGVDPCHFPYRRSDVHDDGLLFLIPLVREWHRLVDDHVEPYRSQVELLAAHYHARKLIQWERAGLYLGPDWRINEVLEEMENEEVKEYNGL